MLDVSVVVCTKNAEATLIRCMGGIQRNNPKEIIVVDGLSTDRTLHLAGLYANTVLSDDGLGLAHARNVGLDAAQGKYIAYVGPDNVLPGLQGRLGDSTLSIMMEALEGIGWSGISAMTTLTGKGWLTKVMNQYKHNRYYFGDRFVIGTPHLWRTEVLRRYRFDDNLTSSDDADLCQRMTADGHKLGIAPVWVQEIGTTTWGEVKKRWLWYGQSDAEFYRKYSPHWTLRRKIQSLLHPLKAELVEPVAKDWRLLPFCAVITGLRYAGWLRRAKRGVQV